MDISLATHQTYIGRPAIELPTPSLILSRPILESNVNQVLEDVSKLGISFRLHVKTLKSLEVTRLVLERGKHKKIIASTLCEIQGALPLVNEGLLEECVYGLPVCASALPRLAELSKIIKIIVMIDSQQHIQLLEEFSQQNSISEKWNVFIKIDSGYGRAGLTHNSSNLSQLIKTAEDSSIISIYGFYAHAGHSYSCRTSESAQKLLEDEVNCAVEASRLMSTSHPVVISFGATPTAHVVGALKARLPQHLKLELHAGNFVANDLQQVSTGLVSESQQTLRVLADVCSVYETRNEALINAGCIALSRETSKFPGFGKLTNYPGWNVIRVSQEHGILGRTNDNETELATNTFKLGQKVFIYCQHACITSSAHRVYYVVDENDVVQETWVPWRGW